MAAKVRFFEHSDAGEVLKLYLSVGQWFEDVKVDKDFIISSSQRPDFRYMVAEEGGEVVGFVGALFFEAVGRAELGPVGVLEERQGAGVGGALTDGMLRFLSEKGIKRVFVKIKAENKRAVGFFMANGFSHEAYLRAYTLKGEDVVQLVAMI